MANQQQQQAVASERTRERERAAGSKRQTTKKRQQLTSGCKEWPKGGWVEGKSKSYKNCSTLSRVAKSRQRAAEMTGGYK